MRELPKEIINMILEYDGRIKYRHGKYMNVFHKHDHRCSMLNEFVDKKMVLSKFITVNIRDTQLYFVFGLSTFYGVCYDYNWSYNNQLEFCYYSYKSGLKKIKTFL